MLCAILAHALLPAPFQLARVSGSAFSAATSDTALAAQQRVRAGETPAPRLPDAGPLPSALLVLAGLLLALPAAAPLAGAAPDWRFAPPMPDPGGHPSAARAPPQA